MESDIGGWDNWFKQIGREWTKLIIGKSFSLRHKVDEALSLNMLASRR